MRIAADSPTWFAPRPRFPNGMGKHRSIRQTRGQIRDRIRVRQHATIRPHARPGRIYLHSGASSGERRLFCFTRDLQVLWEMSNVTSHRGGPALGSNGTLVVSSIGQSSMTVFRTPRFVCGDTNCDGRLDGGDIDPFFECLGAGGCP